MIDGVAMLLTVLALLAIVMVIEYANWSERVRKARYENWRKVCRWRVRRDWAA